MGKQMKVVLVLALIIALGLIFLGVRMFRKLYYITDITILSAPKISSSWTNIDVEKLVAPIEKDRNFVAIVVDSPYSVVGYDGGILDESNAKIQIEVETIDISGKVYTLTHRSSRETGGHHIANFAPATDFPLRTQIKTIRIKADPEFEPTAIWWTFYDTKDMP